MRFLKVLLGGVLAAGLTYESAGAQDVALVVGNTAYRNFQNVSGAETVLSLVSDLKAAGYRVIDARNTSLSALQYAVSRFERKLPGADRAVVVLSGRFLTTGQASWFAPVDLVSPALADVGFEGLSLDAILGYLAQKPGGAGLFLATDDLRGPDGPVTNGVGNLRAPQGVTIVTGPPEALAAAMRDHFIAKGTSVRSAVDSSGDEIRAWGYISDYSSFGRLQAPANESPVDRAFLAEQAYWQLVVDLNTVPAYQSYQRKYQKGMFGREVSARLRALEYATPSVGPEELTELNLNLTRSDRRRVQEQLSLLGFNPRGIDGLFGPGSRRAIKRWQTQNAEPATGFLTLATLLALRGQAEDKARQLADEAHRKQAETDAADAAFWRATGVSGLEPDLIAYLGKYPKGLFSDSARTQLARIEEEMRDTALAEETDLWDAAQASERPRDYRAYLQSYPDGVFADAARAKLDALAQDRENSAVVQAAKAEEKRIPMNKSMRFLLENQLRKLDAEPGRVDGVFDQDTRRALRKYQSARGLEGTGYLTKRTLIQLMAE